MYIYIYINYTDLYCRCLVLTAPEVYGWHIGSIQQPSGWQQSTPCFGPVRWAYLFRWGACKLAVGAPVIMFSTDLNWWIYIIHTCNVYIYIYISQSCIPASRSILECLSRWWVMKIIFFLEGPPTGLAIPYDEHLFWTCCFCKRFLSLHEVAFLLYFEIRNYFPKGWSLGVLIGQLFRNCQIYCSPLLPQA